VTRAFFSHQDQVGGTWTFLLVLKHDVEDYLSFHGRGGRTRLLCLKVGELHPFFLSICSLLCYEKVKDIVRISVPYIPLLRERGGVFLPTEG